MTEADVDDRQEKFSGTKGSAPSPIVSTRKSSRPISPNASKGFSDAARSSTSSRVASPTPPISSSHPIAIMCCAASRRENCCHRLTPSIANTAPSRRFTRRGFPAAKPYLLWRGRIHHWHNVLYEDCGRGASIGGRCCRIAHRKSERPHTKRWNRKTLAQLHSMDYEKTDRGDFGKPGAYIARVSSSRADANTSPEIAEDRGDGPPYRMAACASAAARAQLHRPRRLSPRQHDPASSEAKRNAVLDWELCMIGDLMADFTII